jgi:phosphoadenosine phosphosulfate reductase
MIDKALAQPLDRKIERAIMLLKHWESAALKLDPRGYWVADSFGKDSDCIVELAKMAGVAHHCEHNLTTLDPPELIRYGKRTRPDTHINKQPMSMLYMMANDKSNGPPTRLARWCCELYKEQGGKRVVKIIGVRVEESPRRASLWSEFVRNKRDVESLYLCPIAYWTTVDVWAFHARRNLPHCCLYDEGFTRLGCIGCPLAGPEGQRKAFARWPKYEVMWRAAFGRFWANYHGVPTLRVRWLRRPITERVDMYGVACAWRDWIDKDGKQRHEWGCFSHQRWFEDFGSAQGLWEWWRSGKGQGDGPTCQGAELFAANELGDENADDE